jgi:signal transduction histidine kinase
MRDDWLNLVGHELRTPVAALGLGIHSLSRLLAPEREGNATPEALRPRAQNAERLLARLERRVEELISVSSLVTGSWTPKFETLDLLALTTAFAAETRSHAGRPEGAISLTGPSVVGRFDGPHLRHALVNLVDNALKFGARERVEVVVESDGETATIRVIDHGPGIPVADREQLFTRFHRAASADHYGGFGLGLWVARHIVTAHEGELVVEDTPGGGATLVVRLPLRA